MVVCGALAVAPDSDIYTPQDLAGRPVGLDYGNGTAYAGILMLEGAMSRADVRTVAAPVSPLVRLEMLMRGEIASTVLQEPFISVAEKAGCRLVSTTFFYGTWVAEPNMDVAAYAAFLRALKQSVARINADKRSYLSYFIESARTQAIASGMPDHPLVQSLTPEDFNLGRIQVKEPGPVPEEQARWAWEWMAGWGLLDGEFDAASQLNRGFETSAYELAAAARE